VSGHKKKKINKHIVCLKLPEHPPHPIHAPTNNELSGKNICNAQTKQKPKKKNKIRAKNTPLHNALEKKNGHEYRICPKKFKIKGEKHTPSGPSGRTEKKNGHEYNICHWSINCEYKNSHAIWPCEQYNDDKETHKNEIWNKNWLSDKVETTCFR